MQQRNASCPIRKKRIRILIRFADTAYPGIHPYLPAKLLLHNPPEQLKTRPSVPCTLEAQTCVDGSCVLRYAVFVCLRNDIPQLRLIRKPKDGPYGTAFFLMLDSLHLPMEPPPATVHSSLPSSYFSAFSQKGFFRFFKYTHNTHIQIKAD